MELWKKGELKLKVCTLSFGWEGNSLFYNSENESGVKA